MQKRAKSPVKPKLQSREVTAQQGNVHIRTIDKLIAAGRLDGVKLGRRMMIKTKSADALFGE